MPHTGRAHIGPVINTIGQKNTPTPARASIGIQAAFPQGHDRRQEVHGEAQSRHPGRRHVVVENTLHLAHGLLRGSYHQRLIGTEAQQVQCEDNKGNTERFHSAFNTVSKSRRQTRVNTTSYTSSIFSQKSGVPSPVRIVVVESTIASSAGIEMGKRISGNMISRLRVRIESAAKNVPFTTSAHVPKSATTANCHTGPTERSW